MADKMKEKRMEIARRLSQQHPQVEDFEAAGGDIGDLPGKASASMEDMKVAASPVGGQTYAEAMKSATEADRAVDAAYDQSIKDIYAPLATYGLDEFRPWGGGIGGYEIYKKLLSLEEQGVMKLSDEFRQNAVEGVRRVDEARRDMRDMEEYGDVLKNRETMRLRDASRDANRAKRDLSDMASDVYELTPFGKRAKAFQEKNPGKPYREEGGE